MGKATQSLPVIEPTLASIAAPIGVNEFLSYYWRKQVFHCAGSPDRLASILEAIGSTDVDVLLKQSQRIAALGTDLDAHSGQQPSMTESREAYAKGATLYLRLKADAPLSHWASALGEDLGEPPVGGASIFAVRNRNGTHLHLDWNENFTIQVSGTKQWLVAPNNFVAHPVTNWEIGDRPPLYAHSFRLPAEVPESARAYTLTPGSVLYVPRGFLHQVNSVDDADSLSVNLCFPPSPWAVVLCTLLSARLLELPEFREGLLGAFGRGWGREDFLKRLPGMAKVFSQHAEAIGDDLRGIIEDPRKLEEYLAKRGYPRI